MEDEKKVSPVKVTQTRQYYDATYKRNAVKLAVRESYSVRAAAAVFTHRLLILPVLFPNISS